MERLATERFMERANGGTVVLIASKKPRGGRLRSLSGLTVSGSQPLHRRPRHERDKHDQRQEEDSCFAKGKLGLVVWKGHRYVQGNRGAAPKADAPPHWLSPDQSLHGRAAQLVSLLRQVAPRLL